MCVIYVGTYTHTIPTKVELPYTVVVPIPEVMGFQIKGPVPDKDTSPRIVA